MSVIRKGRLFSIVLILIWVWLTLVLTRPALARWLDNTPHLRPPQSGGTDYLIVAPEALSHSAQAWADYRRERGCAVQTRLLSPDAATAGHIRDLIQQVYRESGRPYPFYVLLLGHAHPGSFFTASYLPADRLDVTPEYAAVLGYDYIASDSAYAMEGDSFSPLLPMAIGRIPARTDDEALRVLDRVRSYEANLPSGAGRLQIELVASDSKFGPKFNRLIDWLVTFMVEEYMPLDYRWHMLYGNPDSAYTYPVRDFPNEVARRLDQGAQLVTYIGHGSSDGLGPALSTDGTRGRIFDLDDLSLVKDASASVFMAIACSAGEYDSPGSTPSLAEVLLLYPDGAAATYAASRITEPAANTLLGKDLFQVLLADRAPTTGEWIWRAESNFRNPGADRALSIWLLVRTVPPLYARTIESSREIPSVDVQKLYVVQQHAYNLFGDPALALAHSRVELDVRPRFLWQPFGRRVPFAGGSDLPPGQTVTVTLDALPGAILPTETIPDDTATRYAQANDKTVGQASVMTNAEGKFAGEIQLSPGLPSGHYLLRALAVEDGVTLVGTHDVYLGCFPIGDVLTSAIVWWLLVSAVLLRKIVPRRRHPEK